MFESFVHPSYRRLKGNEIKGTVDPRTGHEDPEGGRGIGLLFH